MTVIKLDAATLAKVKAGVDPVFLSDETGVPLMRIAVLPSVIPPHQEPTEEELAESENDPVTYSLDEVWEKIRRGERF